MTDKKVVLITGSSSKTGIELAKKFIDNNFKTYGIAKNEHNVFGLQYIPCDVTNLEECNLVIDKIVEESGRIDVVINSASLTVNPLPLEKYSKKDIKNFIDVNLFGVINIIKSVLPHMRKQKSGLIINTSSIVTSVGIPFQSIYSSVKSAIDTLSSSLRNEVKQFGINVSTIHARFQNMPESFESPLKESSEYFEEYNSSINKMLEDEKNKVSTKRIAKAIYNLTTKKKPPLKVYVGISNKLNRLVMCISPRVLREKYIRKRYIKTIKNLNDNK